MTTTPRRPDAGETRPAPFPSGQAQELWMGKPHYLVIVGVLLVAQVGGVLALNYVVDPRAEFGGTVLPPLVAKDVPRKLWALEQLEDPAPVLVLGSSRSSTLSSGDLEALGYASSFNFALGKATVQDLVTTYRFARDQGTGQQAVVIGVEVRQFRPGSPPHPQLQAAPAMAPYTGGSATLAGTAERLLDTYQWGYARDSLRSIQYAVQGYPPGTYTYDADGSRQVRAVIEAAEDGRFDADQAVQNQLDKQRGTQASLPWPGQHELGILTSLVDEIRADGAEVHLFLTPMHPAMVRALSGTDHPAKVAAVRDHLATLCAPGIHVHDLHEVEAFGGTPDAFRDGWHYFGENSRLVGQALATGGADLCASPAGAQPPVPGLPAR